MLRFLKDFWDNYNPFEIIYCMVKKKHIKYNTPIYDRMINELENLQAGIKELKEDFKQDKEILIEELKEKDAYLEAIMNAVPDMLWLKDIDGKYIFANKAIREKLLFDDNPIGKTDIEISAKAKEKFGAENHTYGEMCLDSDKVVIANKSTSQRFMEPGLVDGKKMDLEVHKGIVVKNGKIIGVVGTGRDMTEYRERLLEIRKELRCGKTCPMIEDIFTMYEFKNPDIGKEAPKK